MIRRLWAALAAFAIVFSLSFGSAFAAVDVNSADATQLQTIKGIGPAISAKIVAERQKGGFKDWDDLVTRVPGIGDKNSASMSQGGLTVSGRSKADAPPVAAPPAPVPSKGVSMPAPPSTMVNQSSSAPAPARVPAPPAMAPRTPVPTASPPPPPVPPAQAKRATKAEAPVAAVPPAPVAPKAAKADAEVTKSAKRKAKGDDATAPAAETPSKKSAKADATKTTDATKAEKPTKATKAEQAKAAAQDDAAAPPKKARTKKGDKDAADAADPKR